MTNTKSDQIDEIILLRDCSAVLIPHGLPVTMLKDETVSIMQELGGSFTLYYNGNLVRVDGKDADALGLPVPEDAVSIANNTKKSDKKTIGNGLVDEATVWDKLKTCYDPEIPVNIVDLGLIYECDIIPVNPDDQKKGQRVEIKMTLTAPGCGMGPYIVDDVHNKVLEVDNVIEVKVELVWDPPWNQEMMSEEAQLTLGLL